MNEKEIIYPNVLDRVSIKIIKKRIVPQFLEKSPSFFFFFTFYNSIVGEEEDLNPGRLQWKHQKVLVELQGSWQKIPSIDG